MDPRTYEWQNLRSSKYWRGLCKVWQNQLVVIIWYIRLGAHLSFFDFCHVKLNCNEVADALAKKS